jgi:hypothetical protein
MARTDEIAPNHDLSPDDRSELRWLAVVVVAFLALAALADLAS